MERFEKIEKEPRERKKQIFGESKIEQGLREFKIYRVAPSKRLLKLPDRKPEISGVLGKLLERGLFFTTQKKMALEYRIAEKSRPPLIFEKRGADFFWKTL